MAFSANGKQGSKESKAYNTKEAALNLFNFAHIFIETLRTSSLPSAIIAVNNLAPNGIASQPNPISALLKLLPPMSSLDAVNETAAALKSTLAGATTAGSDAQLCVKTFLDIIHALLVRQHLKQWRLSVPTLDLTEAKGKNTFDENLRTIFDKKKKQILRHVETQPVSLKSVDIPIYEDAASKVKALNDEIAEFAADVSAFHQMEEKKEDLSSDEAITTAGANFKQLLYLVQVLQETRKKLEEQKAALTVTTDALRETVGNFATRMAIQEVMGMRGDTKASPPVAKFSAEESAFLQDSREKAEYAAERKRLHQELERNTYGFQLFTEAELRITSLRGDKAKLAEIKTPNSQLVQILYVSLNKLLDPQKPMVGKDSLIKNSQREKELQTELQDHQLSFERASAERLTMADTQLEEENKKAWEEATERRQKQIQDALLAQGELTLAVISSTEGLDVDVQRRRQHLADGILTYIETQLAELLLRLNKFSTFKEEDDFKAINGAWMHTQALSVEFNQRIYKNERLRDSAVLTGCRDRYFELLDNFNAEMNAATRKVWQRRNALLEQSKEIEALRTIWQSLQSKTMDRTLAQAESRCKQLSELKQSVAEVFAEKAAAQHVQDRDQLPVTLRDFANQITQALDWAMRDRDTLLRKAQEEKGDKAIVQQPEPSPKLVVKKPTWSAWDWVAVALLSLVSFGYLGYRYRQKYKQKLADYDRSLPKPVPAQAVTSPLTQDKQRDYGPMSTSTMLQAQQAAASAEKVRKSSKTQQSNEEQVVTPAPTPSKKRRPKPLEEPSYTDNEAKKPLSGPYSARWTQTFHVCAQDEKIAEKVLKLQENWDDDDLAERLERDEERVEGLAVRLEAEALLSPTRVYDSILCV